jgi:hypothetical protein
VSKRYTAKELNIILKAVLGNAYEHMEAIMKEVSKHSPKEGEPISPEAQSRFKVLNLTMTVINDIVHPAHAISYTYFSSYKPVLDLYVANQKLAFEKNLVPACYNLCCDPLGIKSAAKVKEINEKAAAYESSNVS